MLFWKQWMYFVFQEILNQGLSARGEDGEMPNTKITSNRRDKHRVSIKIPVKFLLAEDQKVLKKVEDWRDSKKYGFTHDLSSGGMQLVSDFSLAVGSVLEFELYILDQVKAVTVYAKVVWTNENSAGLHFLLIKPAAMDVLTSFLKKAS
jgi:c-di-GMP-binding flagellar brake protein YcgR